MARATKLMKLSRPFTKPAAQPNARSSREAQDVLETERLQIGARVKHARMLAGVLMRELAAKVDCTESMISKIERGRVMPSLPMLQRIVEALGRDLASSARSRIRRE